MSSPESHKAHGVIFDVPCIDGVQVFDAPVHGSGHHRAGARKWRRESWANTTQFPPPQGLA